MTTFTPLPYQPLLQSLYLNYKDILTCFLTCQFLDYQSMKRPTNLIEEKASAVIINSINYTYCIISQFCEHAQFPAVVSLGLVARIECSYMLDLFSKWYFERVTRT